MGAEREKEVFTKMLWEVAAFCGVTVVTYSVLDNHFHVLVRVPAARALDDEELIGRYRCLYGLRRAEWMPSPEQLEVVLRQDDDLARDWRRRLHERMHDVSAFMKTLKQRFTVWYNQTHDRFGTLWAERFTSVLVEGSPLALSTVAAYIDLNPVRAGLVSDPGTYRWSGYGEAMAGVKRARNGLAQVFRNESAPWAATISAYRVRLFGKGAVIRSGSASVDSGQVRSVIDAGGRVSVAEALRCRVRYFSAGVVLGSAEFVRMWRGFDRSGSPPTRRKSPTEWPMEGAEWEGLCVARALRSRLIS